MPDTEPEPAPEVYGATRPAPRRGGAVAVAVALVAIVLGATWYFYASPRAVPEAQAPGTAPGAIPGPGGRRGGPDPSRPVPVGTAKAVSGDFDVYLDALGTVTARATVTVRSRVDGQLVRVLFEEGQSVKAGQLLAEIDPRSFEVQLAQARGQLARDQALLTNARLDLERYRTLLAQDSIARQQVDTQESLVRQYEGAIATDQGQVDNARLQLSYTRITAPITGRLGLRQVDSGNMIRAGDANGLVVITQVQPIDVVFPVPETNLPHVQRSLREVQAPKVDVYDRNQTRRLATGKLMTIDNQIDTTTGTVKLKAAFANDDGALFPNQFVNVRMLLDRLANATIVPAAAIQRGAAGTFVYVVQPDNTVAVKPVSLGPVEGERAVVERGIAPGDALVVDGTDRLRDGAKVEPVARDVPAPAAEAPRQRGPANRKAEGKGTP